MADLSVSLPLPHAACGSLRLRNPLLSASGTFGHGLEMRHLVPPELVGGLVSKTVTLRPRHGNPQPRICETEAGFLNSIGLENRGLDAYVREVLPQMAVADTVVFTNVGGETPEDFAEAAAVLDGESAVDALEINLSCPNVDGGLIIEPADAAEVVRRCRAATSKPLFAKLSPNVTDLVRVARAVVDAGADGLTAVNTVLGMKVDWRTRRPGLARTVGGYSGIGIKPIALRCAWQCARAVDVPVIGCGGIATADDVLEFLVAGCAAVQIGTASFGDPGLLGALPAAISARLDAAGVARVAELVGTLRSPDAPRPEALEART